MVLAPKRQHLRSTVKALRAKAAGLDLSAPSPEGMTGPPKGEKRQLLVSDMMYQMTH